VDYKVGYDFCPPFEFGMTLRFHSDFNRADFSKRTIWQMKPPRVPPRLGIHPKEATVLQVQIPKSGENRSGTKLICSRHLSLRLPPSSHHWNDAVITTLLPTALILRPCAWRSPNGFPELNDAERPGRTDSKPVAEKAGWYRAHAIRRPIIIRSMIVCARRGWKGLVLNRWWLLLDDHSLGDVFMFRYCGE